MKKKIVVRIILITFILINIGGIGYYIYKSFFVKDNTPTNISEKVKEIGNYTLYSNTSTLYKTTFEDLNNKADVTKYTNTIAKLFIIDFYSLNYKITNTDIGGLQFLSTDIRDNFKEKAINTIYKYIKSNVYNDRQQQLPEVKEVNIINNEIVEYTYKEQMVEANKITLNWSYKEDLGYDTTKTLYLIKQDNTYVIIEMS